MKLSLFEQPLRYRKRKEPEKWDPKRFVGLFSRPSPGPPLLDYFICSRQYIGWNREAQLLCDLEINDQLYDRRVFGCRFRCRNDGTVSEYNRSTFSRSKFLAA